MRWIIGIDEAGRGPLAGPVTVGIFMAKQKMGAWLLQNIFSNKLRDSKKLSTKKREEIYHKFLELKKENKIDFSVSHISNKVIDKVGISKAVKIGIKKSLQKLQYSSDRKNIVIRLDGLLKAPEEFKNQKTIIKGDEKDVFIACASIVAKVSRDKPMCRLAKKYPKYGFEIHKGYGTLAHRHLIQKHGLSSLHRHSFCRSIAKT
ncbi:MAG: ribonuclease HII [Oligoflexales bacterium]|nr:ribonuclease HII [Oligoflexales bacterium]